MTTPSEPSEAAARLQAEVESRFGVLPDFFRLAPDTPEITANLWGFAKFGYLDNPLPSLFKERLFVYISQFCEVRYCISRHVGFLTGLGRPAGDRQCTPQTVEQIVRLIRRPLPRGDSLRPHLDFCETCDAPLSPLPESESFAEEAIFSCATHLFLQTEEADRCLAVLGRALGKVMFQHLLVFITFVRTAHFWTRLHPELHSESDITELLSVHETLAECVLHGPEENRSQTTQVLLDELVELRKERDQAELLRVTLASIGDAVIATDSAGQITMLNAIAEELTGWTSEAARGKPLDVVFRIISEETRQPAENPARRALEEGVIVGLANHTILIARDGTERFIDDRAAPIRDAAGNVVGSVLVFRDIGERRQAERGMENALHYAESIVDTVREPLIVLDGQLRVRSANRSFYQTFHMTPESTEGRLLYDLASGQWNIPKLRLLLEEILPQNSVVEDFEVEQEFAGAGLRTMLLNAHRMLPAGNEAELVLVAIEDITERKRGEEGLRRLASVVESSNDAIISKSLDGIITTWNAAAERIFGYSAEEAEGRHISMLIPEERADEEDRIIARMRAGKRVEHFDTVRRRKDGRSVHVSLTISPVRDATGQVIGASKIARDIGDRKRADDALRDSELRYRLVGQASNDVIWDWDLTTDQITWNEALQLRFGYTAAQTGPDATWWSDHIHSGDRERVLHRIHEAINGGEKSWNDEYYFRRADGSYAEVLDRGRIVHDPFGRPVRMVGSMFDLTERKQAEEQLRESEQRFLQLGEAIPQFAWMAQPDGRVEWYSNRWYEYTRTRFEQMEGWGWQSLLAPKESAKVIRSWRNSLRTGEPFDMVFQLRGDDGEFRPFLTRAMPFRNSDGQIVRWFGTNTDISEQKQVQEKLREVAARLSEADRRKDEFLATLAHELRNPLAPIRSGLEAMKLAGDDLTTIESIRSTMEQQTQQLIALVDDLLDVSRITKGKLALRKCRVLLAEVVQNAVDTSRPFIEEGCHELTVDIPARPVSLDADPHRLTQVISNLLNNSAKYTSEGGHIWLTAQLEANEVVIAVRDNGIGIPADMVKRIFEMFSQIDRPMEKGYTGLGIGLSLVKSLVEMHDGSIEVSSAGPNQGSEFRVRLPILVETEGEKPEVAAGVAASVEQDRWKVLVVDDNQAAATMLGMVVRMLGNVVSYASDGQQAVETAASFLPDVILMDVGMPRMNGCEAARAIREQDWGRDIYLVALTGWGQEEDRRMTREAGFDYHLVKPAEPSDLQQVFARLSTRTS